MISLSAGNPASKLWMVRRRLSPSLWLTTTTLTLGDDEFKDKIASCGQVARGQPLWFAVERQSQARHNRWSVALQSHSVTAYAQLLSGQEADDIGSIRLSGRGYLAWDQPVAIQAELLDQKGFARNDACDL